MIQSSSVKDGKELSRDFNLLPPGEAEQNVNKTNKQMNTFWTNKTESRSSTTNISNVLHINQHRHISEKKQESVIHIQNKRQTVVFVDYLF